jgi:predicted Rossmann fold flavoprotein
MSPLPPIIVVGAGAAGIIAAWRAATIGAPVLLLERNSKPGIKLLISGGGKCNITHAGSMEELCSAFLRREARFLKPAFHRFDNAAIVRMLEEEGVTSYVRPDQRVFPVSGSADDVVDALMARLRRAGVLPELNARVESLQATDGHISSIRVNGTSRPVSHLVLATGGASYPKTGTTGDGVAWAARLGHTIVPLRAALAPIAVQPSFPGTWKGVAIRGGVLSIYAGGTKRGEFRGDILFTHEGISGPAALEVSRTAALAIESGPAELRLDFFPDKPHPVLDAELNDLVLTRRDRMISTHLEGWLPDRIVPLLLQRAGVDPGKRGHVLTREERRSIVGVLKSWNMGSIAGVPLHRGEVTAGGVSLDEVDPRSMRSRRVNGLYVCRTRRRIQPPGGVFHRIRGGRNCSQRLVVTQRHELKPRRRGGAAKRRRMKLHRTRDHAIA